MNALLCIGCNAYDHLQVLEGAEKDAKEVFALLSGQNGFYDQEASCVLFSPASINTRLSARSYPQSGFHTTGIFPRGE